MLPVGDDRNPIHEELVHAGRQLVRLFIRSVVADGLRVENDDIGEESFLEQAAVLDVEPCRDRRRHFAYGLFECGRPLLAHVPAKNACERPVRAGMRQAPSLNRVGAARVCAELDPRLSDLKGDVLLAHHEEDRANSPALGEHQVERGIDPILALVFGDVVQVPATVLPILNRTESKEEGALGRRERAEILPPPTVSGSS